MQNTPSVSQKLSSQQRRTPECEDSGWRSLVLSMRIRTSAYKNIVTRLRHAVSVKALRLEPSTGPILGTARTVYHVKSCANALMHSFPRTHNPRVGDVYRLLHFKGVVDIEKLTANHAPARNSRESGPLLHSGV